MSEDNTAQSTKEVKPKAKRQYNKKSTSSKTTIPKTAVQKSADRAKVNNENKSSNTVKIMTGEEFNKSSNGYVESNNEVVGAFTTDMFNDGIVRTVDAETIQKWFNNPEDNLENIEKLTTYYYISNPNLFQLYDLAVSLPSLNYRFNADEYDSDTEENKKKIMEKKKDSKFRKVLVVLMKKWNSFLYMLMFKKYE